MQFQNRKSTRKTETEGGRGVEERGEKERGREGPGEIKGRGWEKGEKCRGEEETGGRPTASDGKLAQLGDREGGGDWGEGGKPRAKGEEEGEIKKR